ncbi:MAG: hypothetical protein EXQ85_04330, partial [Alphaproteobacteria bacterium]|nr:hypothetical protein [Alphaproteobacteria bacterium]
MMRINSSPFLPTFVALVAMLVAPAVASGQGASIIMYHRFGETKYPSTNIRLDQLDEHVRELT